jgi:hypothetical protein
MGETFMGWMNNSYKISVRKPKWNAQLQRSGHKWKDNIKMCFTQSVRIWTGYDWFWEK